MPGVGRRKIQPGRPRIREVLGRFVAPVTTQPDDKRPGGRVDLYVYFMYTYLQPHKIHKHINTWGKRMCIKMYKHT